MKTGLEFDELHIESGCVLEDKAVLNGLMLHSQSQHCSRFQLAEAPFVGVGNKRNLLGFYQLIAVQGAGGMVPSIMLFVRLPVTSAC